MKYDHLKQEAYEANIQLPHLRLVLFTFGNVSAADRSLGVFAIKPSGVPYEELSPGKMVIIDFEGQTVEGGLRPSSDTLTHALLYKQWDKLGGIAHTHSTYATAWAQSLQDIPVLGTTHADYTAGAVPCTTLMSDAMIKGDYEYETGNQIIRCFADKQLDYQQTEMVLVGGHAPFTWGRSAEKALHNSAVLEFIAKMAFLTKQLNPGVPVLKETLINKHFQRKHGPDKYYGQ